MVAVISCLPHHGIWVSEVMGSLRTWAHSTKEEQNLWQSALELTQAATSNERMLFLMSPNSSKKVISSFSSCESVADGLSLCPLFNFMIMDFSLLFHSMGCRLHKWYLILQQ
jgi:hypothetical protein